MMIRFMRLLATSGLVVAGLALHPSSAHAAFAVTASAGGSALAGATYANLDGRALGSTTSTANGLTITGGIIVNGSAGGQFQAPLLSGGNNTFFEPSTPATPTADTTNYLSTGTGSATLTFATGAQTYLGLLWGSVDAYNTLTFLDASGNTVGSLTGAQINTIAGSTATDYVNVISTVAFTSVVASSTQNSFEFDNVAYSNAIVPEPSSMALCSIAGLIGVVVARKRAKRAVA